MMLTRTATIEQNPSDNLYEKTKFEIFQRYPMINLNMYDINLGMQYFEVLRLYRYFNNFMEVISVKSAHTNIVLTNLIFQVNIPYLQSQSDSLNLIQYPIRIIYQFVRCRIYNECPSGWFIQELVALALKISDLSQLRCYVLRTITKWFVTNKYKLNEYWTHYVYRDIPR